MFRFRLKEIKEGLHEYLIPEIIQIIQSYNIESEHFEENRSFFTHCVLPKVITFKFPQGSILQKKIPPTYIRNLIRIYETYDTTKERQLQIYKVFDELINYLWWFRNPCLDFFHVEFFHAISLKLQELSSRGMINADIYYEIIFRRKSTSELKSA